jgi:hypothetical protein
VGILQIPLRFGELDLEDPYFGFGSADYVVLLLDFLPQHALTDLDVLDVTSNAHGSAFLAR